LKSKEKLTNKTLFQKQTNATLLKNMKNKQRIGLKSSLSSFAAKIMN